MVVIRFAGFDDRLVKDGLRHIWKWVAWDSARIGCGWAICGMSFFAEDQSWDPSRVGVKA